MIFRVIIDSEIKWIVFTAFNRYFANSLGLPIIHFMVVISNFPA